MWKILIRFPDGRVEEVPVATETVVGRAEGSDVVLTEGGVSRRHARFLVDEKGLLSVEDLGSSNGTFVDAKKIDSPVRLSVSSQVVIGDHEISARPASPSPRPSGTKPGTADARKSAKEGEALAPAVPRSTKVLPARKVEPSAGSSLARRQKPAEGSDGPCLRGLNGATVGVAFPLRGTLVVGRVEGAGIHLDDDSVSRRHAEVTIRGGVAVLRDLGSANGTAVNGVAIVEETTLENGDIVQFGGVEVMFEAGAKASGRAPAGPQRGLARASRSSGLSRARSGALAEAPAGGLAAPRFDEEGAARGRRLKMAGVAAIALLFVIVLGAIFREPDSVPAGLTDAGVASIDAGPSTEVLRERLLAACRGRMNPVVGEVDWKRAKEACEKVLEVDSFSDEANRYLEEISVETACEDHIAAAQERVSLQRLEEAFDAFAKITSKCKRGFYKAVGLAKAPAADHKKAAGQECRLYTQGAVWPNALKACEQYMRVACQDMKDEELRPPPGAVQSLDGKLGKNQWRPSDPLYVNLLRAREKVEPAAGPWSCPEIPVLKGAGDNPTTERTPDWLRARCESFPDKALCDALTLYWQGRINEAPRVLQRLLDNLGKASVHEQAKALLSDINSAAQLYNNGSTQAANEKLDAADGIFRKALALDAALVLGPDWSGSEEERAKALETRVTFVRRAVRDLMVTQTHTLGKALNDRKDFRQGCKLIKLGLSYSAANFDLTRLGYECSAYAQKALARANSCEALRAVLEIAMPKDESWEQARAKLKELNCPAP